MSLTLIQSSTFVSTGFGKSIALPAGADFFRAVNLTQAATTQATGRGVEFEWYVGATAQDTALMTSKTNSTNALNMSVTSSGGFTYVPSTPPTGAPLTGTTISQASSAVATVANTYQNGERVRIYNVVGMKQISGMAFTISAAVSTSFSLPGLDSSGFAAGATAFQVRKIALFEEMLPEYLFITNISQATQAVVKVSTLHDYVAGMQIRLDIPSTYGMSQADGLTVLIKSVTDYTLTVDLDTSGFDAFAFPASDASVNQVRFATLAPSGQKAYYDAVNNVQYGYNVQEAPFRSTYQQPFMYLASGALSPAGSAGDVIVWQAFKNGG